MLEELQRRNMSQNTVRLYLRAVEEFSLYYNVPPDQLGSEHIRAQSSLLRHERQQLHGFPVNCATRGNGSPFLFL